MKCGNLHSINLESTVFPPTLAKKNNNKKSSTTLRNLLTKKLRVEQKNQLRNE